MNICLHPDATLQGDVEQSAFRFQTVICGVFDRTMVDLHSRNACPAPAGWNADSTMGRQELPIPAKTDFLRLFTDSFDQRFHVVRVFFFLSKNFFHHAAAGRVAITEIANDLGIRFDGDALSH